MVSWKFFLSTDKRNQRKCKYSPRIVLSDEPEAVDFLHCWAVVCFRTNCLYNSKANCLYNSKTNCLYNSKANCLYNSKTNCLYNSKIRHLTNIIQIW